MVTVRIVPAPHGAAMGVGSVDAPVAVRTPVGWSMKVSFDCVRVGCGVLFMLLMCLFRFRSGEADRSCAVPVVRLVFLGWSTIPGGDPAVDEGMTMHSSVDDMEQSPSKDVGRGVGHQPCWVAALPSSVGPHLGHSTVRGATRSRTLARGFGGGHGQGQSSGGRGM